MKPRRYSSEAIVLFRRNYSETDRILVVFSKHYGKISLMAKGVRKPKSRKRGSLEIFSQIKFSAARGKNLDLITEAELINSFSSIRKNLKKTAVAYYLVEVVAKLTREDEKNVALYLVTVQYLSSINKVGSLRKLRYDFVHKVLVLLGFWPKGKMMDNPDKVLESVAEREIYSKRVGRKIFT